MINYLFLIIGFIGIISMGAEIFLKKRTLIGLSLVLVSQIGLILQSTFEKGFNIIDISNVIVICLIVAMIFLKVRGK